MIKKEIKSHFLGTINGIEFKILKNSLTYTSYQ